MKKILLLSALILGCLQPANAIDYDKIHKVYHYGIHIPVRVVTFLTNMPVFILRYADQKMDDSLAQKAAEQIKEIGNE